jgi:GNAT superfamily N-acetyltransferase
MAHRVAAAGEAEVRSMSLAIVDAGLEDAAAIAALHASSWRATYRGMLPDAFLDGQLDENRRVLWQERLMAAPPARPIVIKAVEEGSLVGFGCVILAPDNMQDALLDNLHVVPGRTGKGIGTGLLHEARQRAAAASRQRLEVWVLEANAGARRFYERLGATAVERQMVEVIPEVLVPEVRYVFDVRPR